MSEAAVEGGCFCGAVRYRLEDAPLFVNCCHCRDCQTLGGSAFALNGMIEADRLTVTTGGNTIARHEGEARCASCGVLLWALHPMFGEQVLFVRMGTLDEAERFPPDAHFFVRSRHPWVTIPKGVRTFETLPGPDDPPLMDEAARARVAAAQGPR